MCVHRDSRVARGRWSVPRRQPNGGRDEITVLPPSVGMSQPPPIIPGDPAPRSLAEMMPAPGPRPRSRSGPLLWMFFAAIGVATIVVTIVVLVPRLTTTSAEPTAAPSTTPAPTALAAAWRQCTESGQLGDGDKTLILDMEGDDPGSGSLNIQAVTCVLAALDVPTYVTAEMDKTRALDGRQTAAWGAFEASWTYHPDAGLDIIIRQVK